MQKEQNWYYQMNGYQKGPFTKAELASRFQSQQLSGTTKIWNAQMKEWVEAALVDEFAELVKNQTKERSTLRFTKIGVANHAETAFADTLSLQFFDANMQHIATFRERAFALSIDLGFIGVVIFMLLFFDVPIISTLKNDTLAYAIPTLPFIFMILGWFYFTFTEYIWKGSVGKRMMKLKIVNEIGNSASFEQLTGRYFIKVFSILLFGAGCLTMLKSRKGQTLHDTLAGTIVKSKNQGS